MTSDDALDPRKGTKLWDCIYNAHPGDVTECEYAIRMNI